MIRILYVDDDQKFCEFFTLYLGKHGEFLIETEVSALKALKKLRKDPFDIIISDYHMPEMNGLDLLRNIRKEGINLPFILFTGKGREEVVIEAINSGATFYLQKGGDSRATFAELAHKIDQAVSRLRAENALRESEQQYRELSDLLPAGVFECTLDGMITYVNRQVLDSFYIPSNWDIHKISIYNHLVAEDQILAHSVIQDILKSGIDIPREYTAVRADGSQFPTIIHAAPINRDGKIVGIRGVIFDITEQKKAKEELIESKRRLSDVIQFLPEPTFVINSDGVVTFWNRAIEVLTGVPAEDIVGKGDYAYSLPFYGVKRRLLIDFALDPEPKLNGTYVSSGRNGDVIFGESYIPGLSNGMYLWGTASPLRNAHGEIIGAIEAIRDITSRVRAEEEIHRARVELEERVSQRTSELMQLNQTLVTEIDERKHAEQALRESEERYRRFVEKFPDAIVVHDDKSILYVNPAAVQLLGGSNFSDIVGKSPDVFISDSDADYESDGKGLQTWNFSASPVEWRVRRIDKTEFDAEISSIPIVDRNGPALLVVMRDITSRKQAEAQLRRYAEEMVNKNEELDFLANQLLDVNHQLDLRVRERTIEVLKLLKQKDMIILQIGHDLKTPLTPLIALLPNILKSETDSEKKEILSVLLRSVHSIRNQVEKILLIARLDQGNLEQKAEPVLLLPILREVIQNHMIFIEKKNIRFYLRVSEGTKAIFSPRDAIIVFDNLLSNAVKYTPENGMIDIEAIITEENVCVSFTDTGVGLTKEEASNVFEEFYMADYSRHDRSSSGLGLAIVRRLIRQYGGTINVSSEGKGKGTTFVVCLRAVSSH